MVHVLPRAALFSASDSAQPGIVALLSAERYLPFLDAPSLGMRHR